MNEDNQTISKQGESDYYTFTYTAEKKILPVTTTDTLPANTQTDTDTTQTDTDSTKTDTSAADSRTDTTTTQEEIEITVSSVKVNNKSVETYLKIESMIKDDLVDGKFIIEFTVSGVKGVKQILLTLDGSSFSPVTYNTAQEPAQISYSFTPAGDKEYAFNLQIKKLNDSIIDNKFFAPLEKINYVNKTNQQLITQLLDDFCNALLTSDKTKFMTTVSEDFAGNNEGFKDYSEIETSIKNSFNKTTTNSCSYSSAKIDISSATRAKVDFTFKRRIKFNDIDKPENKLRSIETDVAFDLIKTDGVWKILTDRSSLLFMRYFPLIPSPPGY